MKTRPDQSVSKTYLDKSIEYRLGLLGQKPLTETSIAAKGEMKQIQEACSSLGGSQKRLGTITIVADSASKIFYNKIRKVHKKC